MTIAGISETINRIIYGKNFTGSIKIQMHIFIYNYYFAILFLTNCNFNFRI